MEILLYDDVFKDELGTIKDTKAKIEVDPATKPRYFKPRPVPYALRSKIDTELARLQSKKIAEPLEY